MALTRHTFGGQITGATAGAQHRPDRVRLIRSDQFGRFGAHAMSLEAHREAMGRMMSAFTKVAANNPYAYFGERRTSQELVSVDADNRYICFPYPKLLNARDGVNQSAALLMTSVGQARELGIDESKWVFLHGCAEASERLVTDRRDLAAAPAMRVNTQRALDMARKSVDDMAFFDIYSCFPVAVEVACAELGLAEDDPRGLTVTGGLPYFGGPGNNYSMHGVATMVERLRDQPGSYGMVTANGGWLSKHATGIYSTSPFLGTWSREDPALYREEALGPKGPPLNERPEGTARVETYTIGFDRDGPKTSLIVGRLDETGERFVAHLPDDEAIRQRFVDNEGVGLRGHVTQVNEKNIFELPA